MNTVTRALAATLAAAVILTGCGSSKATSKPTATESEQLSYTLAGTMTLVGSERGSYQEITGDEYRGVCQGNGGFDDQREGAQVTVRDESGNILGVDRLSVGEYRILDRNGWLTDLEKLDDGFNPNLYVQRHEPLMTDDEQSQNNRYYPLYRGLCVFEFAVDIDEPADFYSVEVASRGEISYSHTELETAGWNVDLTLGN